MYMYVCTKNYVVASSFILTLDLLQKFNNNASTGTYEYEKVKLVKKAP